MQNKRIAALRPNMLQISMEDEEAGAIGDQSRIESKPDSPVDALNNTVGEMVNFLGNSRTDIREANNEDSRSP